MNYAVIDLGSNSVRLSVYDCDGSKMSRIFSKKEVVGLAGYIEKERLADTGIHAACSVLNDFRETAEIPVTKLFGRSPAGMNATGESDMQNYYDAIEEKQESALRPAIEKLLPVLCVSALGYVPDDLDFAFNPIRRPSEEERKTLAKQTADAVIAVYNSGLISDRTALRELKQSSESTGMWSSITDEDIAKASDEPQPSGGEMGMGMPGMEGLGFPGPSEPVVGASAADAAWNESDHPRDDAGRFGEGGGSSAGGEGENNRSKSGRSDVETSADGENSFGAGFEKKSKKRHLKKHLHQFPGMSEREYEQRGIKLAESKVGGDVEGFRAKNGNIVRYDRKTMELAVGDPNKNLKSFHKLGTNPKKAYEEYLEIKQDTEE